MKKTTKLWIALALLLCGISSALANTVYVTPNGAGDGSSWDQASGSIVTALSSAASGDEVWVKQGIYNLTAGITWKSGVNVYGGFVGTETSLGQRAIDPSLTILDGSGLGAGVVTLTASALAVQTTWSGFTFAPRTGGTFSGAIRMHANCILENCVVTGQSTTGSAGAIYVQASTTADMVIKNCIIINNNCNNSSSSSAGGIYFTSGATANLNIINCTFAKNTTTLGQERYTLVQVVPVAASIIVSFGEILRMAPIT